MLGRGAVSNKRIPIVYGGEGHPNRTDALQRGEISCGGIDLNYVRVESVVDLDGFDAAEFSAAAYIMMRARRDYRYVALPVFLFGRHSGIRDNHGHAWLERSHDGAMLASDLHLVVLKREIYERDPWIALSLFQAFELSRLLGQMGVGGRERLISRQPCYEAQATSAYVEHAGDARPYGMRRNRKMLGHLVGYLHEQVSGCHHVDLNDLFAPETHVEDLINSETFRERVICH